MFKLELECRIVAQDEDTGYFHRRVVTGKDFYSFLITLTSALSNVMAEAGNYHKAKEIEDMESGELPF